MKNAIITIILIIVGIGGLVWWGKSAQLVTVDSSNNKISTDTMNILTADETIYDFGKILMKDGNVSKIFNITNTTENDINLKTVATSCMCTTAYIINGTSKLGPFAMEGMGNNRAHDLIKAGESRNVEVIYDPNAHGPAGVGIIDRFVFLTDDQGNKLELEVKGIVAP